MQLNQVLESWLSRGFKGSKCKTLLKLASSRIKLLRNKRGIQLKQLRKELAHLLETGQEPTAFIRVEHIIREQNVMDAYELLEHFSELLIVRMPIMEMQRECPLDLKEAVASLIFAAPRASDLPELLEVQSLFSLKYGKEFVASATQLWPNCGVNRMIIEKLSVRAPSARTKVDLMLEIAEEFNVKWDPADTEQELTKTPEDLLDGTCEFIGPIQMLPIPLCKGDSQSQALSSTSPGKEEKSVSSLSNADMEAVDPNDKPQFVPFVASTPGSQVKAEPSRFYSPPRESSITQQSGLMEEALLEKSHSRAKSEGSMNFKDIIEAAESAAENAENAARAAREAVELCNEPQFVPFVAPTPAGARVKAEPSRLYSTPQESSVTKQSGLMEEALIEKSHTRIESEGSRNLKDIIEAAESAAENAEKAARTAREAVELCISQISVKSKGASNDKGNLQSPKSDVSSRSTFKSGLTVDDYDWTQLYDGKKQEDGAVQSEEADHHKSRNTNTYLIPDEYDWSVETSTRKPQEEFASESAQGKGLRDDGIYNFNGEVNHKQAFYERDEADSDLNQFGSVPEGDLSRYHSFSYGAPQFDDTAISTNSKPFQKQSSLEDDSYYSYPNLFSKSSNA